FAGRRTGGAGLGRRLTGDRHRDQTRRAGDGRGESGDGAPRVSHASFLQNGSIRLKPDPTPQNPTPVLQTVRLKPYDVRSSVEPEKISRPIEARASGTVKRERERGLLLTLR